VLAGLVLLCPLALLTLPLWAPVAVVVFLTGAASLLASSAGVPVLHGAASRARRRAPGRALLPAGRGRGRGEPGAEVLRRLRSRARRVAAPARLPGEGRCARGVGRGGGWRDVVLLFVRVFLRSF
jgi:hypothetical protein